MVYFLGLLFIDLIDVCCLIRGFIYMELFDKFGIKCKICEM